MQRIILCSYEYLAGSVHKHTIVLTVEEFDNLSAELRNGSTFQFGYFLNEDDLLEARREAYQKGFQEGMKLCIEKLPTLRAFSDEQVADMLRNLKEQLVI